MPMCAEAIITSFLRSALRGLAGAVCLLTMSGLCCAGNVDTPFYRQLIHFHEPAGYQPTRTYTIVTDPEHGDRLVAEDDPNLRFNMYWMEQFQPGYRVRRGGAALGSLVRDYFRSLYREWRAGHEVSGYIPDANGRGSLGFGPRTDYDLRLDGSAVKLGVNYSF